MFIPEADDRNKYRMKGVRGKGEGDSGGSGGRGRGGVWVCFMRA